MKHKKKYYSAFNFTISSEIELPELINIRANNNITPDIIIRLKNTPENLKKPQKTGVRFQASENEFLLFVDNVADFYIHNKQYIDINIKKTATIEEVKLFLLGSAFGAIIYQKGKIPFHGSAVKINNKAAIISGVSGAGKSTTTLDLTMSNLPLITDDVSLISYTNNKAIIYPGFPRIKLWEDTINFYNINKNNLKKIRPIIEKYSLKILPE